MTLWITSTPPTPNGPLHIGHMAGPYIAADVLRRAMAQRGLDVRLTTGIDDNQTYVPRRAWVAGEDPRAVADTYGTSIQQSWREAGVLFDDVVIPRGDVYESRVRSMMSALVDNGTVIPRASKLPYCERCDDWCHDAFVRGGCPHCGASTNGNACEFCCLPNRCADIVDPVCVRCDDPTELRETQLLVLPLEPLRSELARYWEGVAMPARLRLLCETMAATTLPEIIVAHPGDWGVSVPIAGFEDHRIYVWLEMAEGYAAEYPDDLADDHDLVQFFGMDNGYFHAALMPAVNIALGRHGLLARRFIVNEFLLLNGRKFSTSRAHAVWAEDFLPFAGQDLTRLHCSLHRPHVEQTDFTLGALAQTEAVLDEWQETFASVLVRLAGAPSRQEPQRNSSTDLEHERIVMETASSRVQDALLPESFDPRAAASELIELARRIRTLDLTHPMTSRHGDAATEVLRVAVRAFTQAAGPIVPNGSRGLLQALETGVAPAHKLFGLGV